MHIDTEIEIVGDHTLTLSEENTQLIIEALEAVSPSLQGSKQQLLAQAIAHTTGVCYDSFRVFELQRIAKWEWEKMVAAEEDLSPCRTVN